MAWAWFACCILISTTVEATTGFGSIVIALSLGALALPVAAMLPVLVPLNLFMTSRLVWKYRQQVDRSLLLQRILPLMAVGTVAGYVLRPQLNEQFLRLLLALLIIWFSLRELARLLRGQPGRAHPRWRARLLTLGAGISHGLFASGGPLLVYSLAGSPLNKGQLRATLVTVWLALNLGLTLAFALDGSLVPALPRVAAFLPVVLGGYLLGEFFHRRLDEQRFRLLIFSLLLLVGIALGLR